MLSLIFKIGGDNNPLKKSLAQVPEEAKKAGKEAGSQFGKELGSQAKGALMSFIGAGALIGIFRKAMDDARNITKESERTGLGSFEVQALERASERTGLSPDEILARGKVNPRAFVSLMTAMEAQSGYLKPDQVSTGNRFWENFKEGAGTVASGVLGVAGGAANQLERLTYGGFAGAAGVADWMSRESQPGPLRDRFAAISREYATRAEIGAESIVGVPGSSTAPTATEIKAVEQAIRALHQTVADKL